MRPNGSHRRPLAAQGGAKEPDTRFRRTNDAGPDSPRRAVPRDLAAENRGKSRTIAKIANMANMAMLAMLAILAILAISVRLT
jgi:hypothetical protein